MKHRLTGDQEFQLLKLVLDKFLWIGIIIMLFGGWQLIQGSISNGVAWIAAGAIILILLIILMVRHYEITP